MFAKIFLYFKNFDWILFLPVFLLSIFGLVELYSIALGQENVELLNFQKQLGFVGGGMVVMFFLAFIDYRTIRSYTNHLYILGILLLGGVLVFGVAIRGSARWLDVAIFGVQPVEVIKLILILFLAKFFASRRSLSRPFKQLFVTGGATLLLALLVFMQPDLGSSMLLFMIWVFMLAVAGFPKKYFLAIGVTTLLIFGGMWNFSLHDYQKERVLTFLNPAGNPLDQSYNISQAIIAVGSGGLTGRGLGFGSQSQLKFLPEAENDFIFAVIAEELGLLGVSLVILLFAVFFYRCLTNVKKIDNDFGILFILGGAGLIFMEMFINIGMNIGLVPVVGMSLPFVSYGGSALISKFAILGIMENIIIRSKIR